jgi:hypothetical protein
MNIYQKTLYKYGGYSKISKKQAKYLYTFMKWLKLDDHYLFYEHYLLLNAIIKPSIYFNIYDVYTQILRHPFSQQFRIEKREENIHIVFSMNIHHFENEYLHLDIMYNNSIKLFNTSTHKYVSYYNWKVCVSNKTLFCFHSFDHFLQNILFHYWKWKMFLICQQMKFSPYFLKKHIEYYHDIDSWTNKPILFYINQFKEIE